MLLPFGKFLGREVNRVSIPGFEVTLRRSGSGRIDTRPHSHSTPNILIPLQEGYWSEADGFDAHNPMQLIYTPAGIMHRDSMARLGGRYLAISLRNDIAAESLESVRHPVAVERPNALRIAWAIAASNLSGDLSELFAEEACLNIIAEIKAQQQLRMRPRPRWLRHVIELCHGSLRPLPRIGEIAARIGVHPVHVTRVFRSAYGVPLSKYLASIRAERAAAALRAGTLSVAEIAAATGYSDQSHLCRSFKSLMRMAPTEYRAIFAPADAAQ